MKMEYTFTLKYRLPSIEQDGADIAERLYGGGCDDALIGIGSVGRVALEFAREADSALAAMESAMADVERAVPGACLIEVAPDWVGLTDIAEVLSISRQYARKLMQDNIDTFPVPVHEGKASLWHLAHVLEWLDQYGNLTCPAGIQEVAQAALRVNQARENRGLAVLGSGDLTGNQLFAGTDRSAGNRVVSFSNAGMTHVVWPTMQSGAEHSGSTDRFSSSSHENHGWSVLCHGARQLSKQHFGMFRSAGRLKS